MLTRHWMVYGIVCAITIGISAGAVGASEQEQTRQGTEMQEQEQIYGSQLMTEQERAEYRAAMRAAKTAEEREKIRKEHHERMEARAKERGMTLPDEPPMRGDGMGMGPGGGMGKGPGGGRP